jgi:sugar phosphate isomerase/epimerase
VNDWLERVEDALRLLPQIGRTNVGVMFNFCHWLKVDQEQNLLPLLRAAKPHLLAVSINGSDRGPEVRTGKGQWIVPLDSGSFDQRVVLKALSDIGYSGPIGLQCYGIPGDARDHLARSMSAWKKLKGQVR